MYEKQTWNTGDVITEEKLNHMEDGIASCGGMMAVNSNHDSGTNTYTLDKTWKEIYDAYMSGINVYTKYEVAENGSLTIELLGRIERLQSSYEASFGITTYSTDSENGYPKSGGDF